MTDELREKIYAFNRRVKAQGEALGILGVESVPQARVMRAAVDIAVTRVTDDDDRLRISALYPKWAAGEHAMGDIYTTDEPDQVWECFAAYDNAAHPDIVPGSAAWGTFNRPLHGKTRETAREYVAPTGAHDMYHVGEWMIFGGRYCCCKLDTSYSPEGYPAAWAVDDE